jgi:hypothetical protein
MLVQFFRNNNSSSFIFLPLLSLVLWANGFVLHPNVELQEQIPAFELFNHFQWYVSFVKPLLALLFILTEAFLLNFMVNKYDLLPKPSFLPALLYIVLMSMDNSMFTLRSSLIANFIVLLIIYGLMESYRKDSAFSNAFDIGALIAIATFFYQPTAMLLPILGIGLLIMRPFNWREWVICLIGICTPYIFVYCYYFWSNQLYQSWSISFFFTASKTSVNYSSSLLTVFCILLLIVFASLRKIGNNLRGGMQKKSKSTLLLIWIALFSLLALYVSPSLSCNNLSLLIIPVSVFCALYLSSVKKRWWGEFLFSILFISIIVNLMSVYF